MPDPLYQRYQSADRAYQAHADSCGCCTRDIPECAGGKRLRETFERLQDAYLARLKQRTR
ncbi:hypothetical protein [Streptomyces sp. 900105245]